MLIDVKTAARLLGGEARGNRIVCPGPGHTKRDRSLSITFSPDGTFATNSFAGDDFRDCRDHVKAVLGLDDDRPRQVVAPAIHSVSSGSTRARVDMLRRLWDSCIPIAGTLGERYLASRGLSYEGDAWRFRLASRALIAIITDALSGDPCGFHETLLDAEGRKTGRLMHGRAAGGCVRLYDQEAPSALAVAEGIETALATGVRPVWACLSSTIMAGFPVLDGVRSLTVYADHDRAGIKAANAVGERWHAAGREVVLSMPADPGKDFADYVEAA
jgi:putative DNA primase/helicase